MAVTLTHISSTTSSVTLEVWHNNTGGTRVYWDYYSGGQWLNRTYTLVSSGSYGQYTFTSLNSGTGYNFRVRIVNGSNLAELASTTTYASTTSPPVAPPTPTGLSATAVSQSGVYLSWNGVSNVSYYELSIGYPLYQTQYIYSQTYFTWTGLSPATQYGWQVKAVGTNGLSSNYSSMVYATTNSPPVTAIPTGFSMSATSSSSITASWNGVYGASMYEFAIYSPTSHSGTTTSTSRAISGLAADTQYYGYVRAYSSEGGWSGWSSYSIARTKKGRPGNFAWTYAKTSGGSFNLYATEWNALFNRINDFRTYKDLATTGYTSAYSSYAFTSVQYNEARNAIYAMNPSTTIPPWRGSAEIIYASEINRLRDALNSIS